MPVCVKLDVWDQPDEELGSLAMYDATCRSELQLMETTMFQHCRYAVAREWIITAIVLTLLIVASLR